MNTSNSIVEGVREILKGYPDAKRDSLIPILQAIQEKQGYLSRDAVVTVGEYLSLPASKIYGVATFYSQFSLQPKGQNVVSVCLGTACYVKGSQKVLEKVCSELELEVGQTTQDGVFTVQATRCLGACGLAPVMMINDEVYGRLVPEDVPGILAKYKA